MPLDVTCLKDPKGAALKSSSGLLDSGVSGSASKGLQTRSHLSYKVRRNIILQIPLACTSIYKGYGSFVSCHPDKLYN